MSPPIVFHPAYDAPAPPGGRFPMGKFAALRALLAAEGLAPNGFASPDLIAEADLVRAHDAHYVRRALSLLLTEAETRRIGLPLSAEIILRARASVGGGLLAARLALEHGVACNTAGGSHHAGPDGGAGFCVFNDVAVAALALLAEGRIARALVIDLDVHHGDGTARIFANDDRVFTFSAHCRQNYPSVKPPSSMDLAFERGVGDTFYLDRLSEILPRLFDLARPDLVFYIAGVDVHAEDRLGFLNLTDSGIAAREKLVLSAAKRLGAPLAGLIGGGYGADVGAIARRHAILHRTAAEIFG